MGLYKRKLYFIVREKKKCKCKCKHKQIIRSMVKNPKYIALHMCWKSWNFEILPNSSTNTCEVAQLPQSCRPRAQLQEWLLQENTPSDCLQWFIYVYKTTHPAFHSIHLKMKRTYLSLTFLPILVLTGNLF